VDGEVRYTHPVADTVLTADERSRGVCRAVSDVDPAVRLQEDDRLRSLRPSRLVGGT